MKSFLSANTPPASPLLLVCVCVCVFYSIYSATLLISLSAPFDAAHATALARACARVPANKTSSMCARCALNTDKSQSDNVACTRAARVHTHTQHTVSQCLNTRIMRNTCVRTYTHRGVVCIVFALYMWSVICSNTDLCVCSCVHTCTATRFIAPWDMFILMLPPHTAVSLQHMSLCPYARLALAVPLTLYITSNALVSQRRARGSTPFSLWLRVSSRIYVNGMPVNKRVVCVRENVCEFTLRTGCVASVRGRDQKHHGNL